MAANTDHTLGPLANARQREELLEFILERAGCFILTIDTEYKITGINHIVSGLNSEDVMGTDARNFISAEHKGLFTEHLDHVLKTGESCHCELMGAGAHSSMTIYQSSLGPLCDDNGAITGVVIHAVDISPQENVKPDMRARNQFMRGILQNMSVVLFCLNKDGVYTESTGLGLKRRGLQDRELLGQKAAEVYPRLAEHVDRALGGGSSVYEVTGEHDGKPWAYIVYIFFDAERGEGAIGFSIDISERKEIERALRANMEQMYTLVERAPVCIHDIDIDGRIVSMNPAGLRIVGMANEQDVLGLPYLDFIHEEDRDNVDKLFKSALLGNAMEFEFTASVQGQRRSFASSFIPVRDSSGSVVRITGMSHEITEQRRAQEEAAALEATFAQQHWEIAKLQEDIARLKEGLAERTKKKVVADRERI